MRRSLDSVGNSTSSTKNNQELASRRRRMLGAAVRGVVERLEDRRLLSVAQTWVNDNWLFDNDQDGSGGLSLNDTVKDASDGSIRIYGFNAFGTVTGTPTAVTSLEAYDEINEAIASARSGQVIKPVLVFDAP